MTARLHIGLGSAPAPGAANDALVVGLGGVDITRMRSPHHAPVGREGAANGSRGGCAPPARLYERKHAALEALKKSLLHQAFTGAL